MSLIDEFNIHKSWKPVLMPLTLTSSFLQLCRTLQAEFSEEQVFPTQLDIFRCFQTTSFEDVKVVILGQDPYHGPGQAHGLSFSVPNGIKVPPSLRNIQKLLKVDYKKNQKIGCLDSWADQGVLLLNTVMTVRHASAGSHRGLGWEAFTDGVLKGISDNASHVVFLLWGKDSRSKAVLIDQNKHLILEAPHPSPLSAYRGFFDCDHFAKANRSLAAHKLQQIDWHSPWASSAT